VQILLDHGYGVAGVALQRHAQVSIHVLASGHEALFEGPEIESACRRRCRKTQGGGRKDLLGVGADHKALAEETSGEGGCGAQADPRQALQERGDAPTLAAKAAGDQRRPYPQEHREAFEKEYGETVSTSTVGRTIAGLPDGGWPIKKVEDSSRA
jgi:hypothetical protein